MANTPDRQTILDHSQKKLAVLSKTKQREVARHLTLFYRLILDRPRVDLFLERSKQEVLIRHTTCPRQRMADGIRGL